MEPKTLGVTLEELDKELGQLYLKDATVHAWMKTAQITGASEEVMLKSLVIQLAKEKQQYFDMATTKISMEPSTPILYPFNK